MQRRDAELEAFSNAVWQRQERARAGGVSGSWPTRAEIKERWPLLALDLLIADWKHHTAHVDADGEIELELLDPPAAPVAEWRELYAQQLASSPALASCLEPREGQGPGDNLELVYEMCGLTAEERLVLRAWLAERDLAELAGELGERTNTQQIRLRNALYRIRHVAENGVADDRRVQRRVVRQKRDHALDRARRAALQRAHAPRARAHRLRRAS